VLPKPRVALGDLAMRGLVRPGFVGLGGFDFAHGLRERSGVEYARQPAIELLPLTSAPPARTTSVVYEGRASTQTTEHLPCQ
jgi:hypothetical protein